MLDDITRAFLCPFGRVLFALPYQPMTAVIPEISMRSQETASVFVATEMAAVFVQYCTCLATNTDAMNAFNFSTTRRYNQVVILTGPALSAKATTSISVRLSRALTSLFAWIRCNCTPVRIVRSIFGEKASMAVAIILISAMWWQLLAISNPIEAQTAVATYCLCLMPWGIVWAIRATKKFMEDENREGGDK